jgi:hypothetical protein
MYTFQIKSYRPSCSSSEHAFYVLSKGNNAGKPLDAPCPNCFLITATSAVERDKLYWICYLLWKGGCLRHLLVGSVIPFIRIAEIRHAIEQAIESATDRPSAFDTAIKMLQDADRLERNLRAQLSSITVLKATIVRSVVHLRR